MFICIIFSILHVSDIIWYFSFSVWLTSLSMIISRSILKFFIRNLIRILFFSFFLSFFWLHCVARRILVPRPGIEPGPSAVKAWTPNHWTAREFPQKTVLVIQTNTLAKTQKSHWLMKERKEGKITWKHWVFRGRWSLNPVLKWGLGHSIKRANHRSSHPPRGTYWHLKCG